MHHQGVVWFPQIPDSLIIIDIMAMSAKANMCMYSSDEGGCCLRILGAIGSILGIIAAIITIIAYFYPDRTVLYAVSDVSQVEVEPAFEFFEDIRLEVADFSENRVYIPIILAVVLILISIGYGSLASEEWDVFSMGEALLAGVGVFLVILPCTICWIWLYSDMVGETIIGLFLTTQLIGAIGSAVLNQ